MGIKSKLIASAMMIFILISLLAFVSVFYLSRIQNAYKVINRTNDSFLVFYNSIVQSANNLERLNNACMLHPADCISGEKEHIAILTGFKNSLKTSDTLWEGTRSEVVVKEIAFLTDKFDRAYETKGFSSAELENILVEMEGKMQVLYATFQEDVRDKTQTAEAIARTSKLIVSALATLAFLLSLAFVTGFPSYIADPLVEVTARIKEIAKKQNRERITYRNRKDEVGEIAFAFNTMAARLEEYEKSSLNEVLTEKKRIEAIVKNLNEGILLIDQENVVQVINPVAAHIFGITASQATGRRFEDLAARNDKLKELGEDLKQKQPGKPIRIISKGEEQFFSKEIFEIQRSGRNAKDGGVIISLKNITGYKKLDLDKTTFMAKVSHELKTPVSSINLCLKLLEDERVGKLAEEQKELVGSIKEESKRLSNIIKELLDISQVETGNIRLNVETVEPAGIIDYSLQIVQRQLEEKKIRMVLDIPEIGYPVKADVEKTVWVLTNLLSNAIRYSEENSEILIALVPVINEVHISVKDNGPGISFADQEKIFLPFVQLNHGKQKEGVGLGLAISREFIQRQGGNLWVESHPGAGARFVFSLLAVRE